jgi:hypothetical protein
MCKLFVKDVIGKESAAKTGGIPRNFVWGGRGVSTN